MNDLKDTLLEIEQQFWAAPPDPSIYETAFADDGLMVLPMESGILNKSQVIESVRASQAWTSYVLTHALAVGLGDECAVLVYQAQAERMGMSSYRALISSTYQHRGNRWIMVLHQQTPLPG